jgi:hypothetical protein
MVTTLKEGFETAKFLDSEFGSIQYVETNELGIGVSAEDVCRILGLMPYWKLATIYETGGMDLVFTTVKDRYPEFLGMVSLDYLYAEELVMALNNDYKEFLKVQFFINKQHVFNLIGISHKADSFKDAFKEYIEKQF